MTMQSQAHEIGARIRESLLTEQVLDEVAEALGMALSLDRVYVHLDAGRPSHRQWSRADLPTLPPPPPHLTSPAGTVIRPAASPDDPLARAAGAGAYVSAPFGFNEEVFGTVILVSAREREWLPDEVDLIDAVCADLGRVFQAVRLYEHERQLVDRLRELDQHKTDFIATVSHELRTPLTSVLGYVEVLTSGEAGPVTERQLKSLRIIERNAERLGEMVADLLTLSRIESGTFALQLRPMRVLEAVQRAVQAIMPLASGVGLSVSVDVPAELWTAADLPQLQRIVGNLLGNAVKFSRRGGEVHVRAHGGENTVVLEIADDGDGVPQHELAALFEPFQRGSNAVVNATPGPGLGLAVVRSIVEQHHGHARLTSTPGQGTTVTIVLPRICPPPEAQDNVQAVAGSA
jgi:signal transduction histidine kinase